MRPKWAFQLLPSIPRVLGEGLVGIDTETGEGILIEFSE
jgi:hypothetical protein